MPIRVCTQSQFAVHITVSILRRRDDLQAAIIGMSQAMHRCLRTRDAQCSLSCHNVSGCRHASIAYAIENPEEL